MKKLLLLFILSLGIFAAKAQVYPINFPVDATSRNYGSGTESRPNADARWTWAVGIEDGDTIAISTAAKSAVYHDKTSSSITAWVGAGTIQPYLHFHGVWMYRYVYIDWNGDGQFGDGTDPGDELVSWAGVTSGALNDLPAITIPEGTPAGTYYIRFKVDWDNTDPGGKWNNYDNDIVANGGVVVDTRLILTDEKQDVPINVTPGTGNYTNEDVDGLYDALYKGTSQTASRTDRYNQTLVLNGKTITINSSGSSRLMYKSFLNSDDCFHLVPGTSYTPTRTWTGVWMHHYLYIDYDHDGVYASGGATASDDKELVTYTCFNDQNKLGESVSNNGTAVFPAFTVPDDVEPGIYAMRLKMDWDWLDPTAQTQKGTNNFLDNAGEIEDFRVIIHYPEFVLNAESSVVDENGDPVEVGGSSVRAFLPKRSVKTDGAYIEYDGDNVLENSGFVNYGQAVSVSVAPESEDYLLSEVKVKYGFNLDNAQYVAGIKQWDEVDLTSELGETGGTINIPASMTQSDEVRIVVKTIDNPVTAIGRVEVEKQQGDVIYDLQGRRVQQADKGIYIVNGKKVIF